MSRDVGLQLRRTAQGMVDFQHRQMEQRPAPGRSR
jgi:hypothetical protein